MAVILLNQIGNAQPNTLSFSISGTLGVQGGESFEYVINATDSAGYLKGYALTYESRGKDTRATIIGRLDRKNKTLYFRETEIAYNKGFSSNATLCLIEATLSYGKDESGKTYTLSGPIKSSDAGNVSCAKGSILFTNENALKAIFGLIEVDVTVARPVERPVGKPALVPAKILPKIAEPIKTPEKPVPAKVVYVYDTAKPKSVSKVENPGIIITAGKEKVLNWQSDTLILEVWDGGTIDGDIISIILNDRPVAVRLKLTAAHSVFRIPLKNPDASGLYTLSILAENEGAESPNTANLLLIDGSTSHSILAHNEYGREAVVRLKPRQK